MGPELRKRIAAAVILSSWASSSSRLVSNSTYFRDDYRGVAKFLEKVDLDNTFVVLSGDADTHHYYLPRIGQSGRFSNIVIANNLESDELNKIISAQNHVEIVIITHKPKYYDHYSSIANWIGSHEKVKLIKKLINFEIWAMERDEFSHH